MHPAASPYLDTLCPLRASLALLLPPQLRQRWQDKQHSGLAIPATDEGYAFYTGLDEVERQALLDAAQAHDGYVISPARACELLREGAI